MQSTTVTRAPHPGLWLLLAIGVLLHLDTATANIGLGAPPAVLMRDWNMQLNVTWNASIHVVPGVTNYILEAADITAGQVSTLTGSGGIAICYVR
jgi:hypothetical protein